MRIRTAKPRQEQLVNLLPYFGRLPLGEPAPAVHSRAEAHFLGQQLPRNPVGCEFVNCSLNRPSRTVLRTLESVIPYGPCANYCFSRFT